MNPALFGFKQQILQQHRCCTWVSIPHVGCALLSLQQARRREKITWARPLDTACVDQCGASTPAISTTTGVPKSRSKVSSCRDLAFTSSQDQPRGAPARPSFQVAGLRDGVVDGRSRRATTKRPICRDQHGASNAWQLKGFSSASS